MNKFIKNNRVAVLINPDHGWYTKHKDLSLVFDPVLIEQVLSGSPVAPEGLQVEWLIPGDNFAIEQWQGQEIVRVLVPHLHIPFSRDEKWLIA